MKRRQYLLRYMGFHMVWLTSDFLPGLMYRHVQRLFVFFLFPFFFLFLFFPPFPQIDVLSSSSPSNLGKKQDQKTFLWERRRKRGWSNRTSSLFLQLVSEGNRQKHQRRIGAECLQRDFLGSRRNKLFPLSFLITRLQSRSQALTQIERSCL